jgi:hypothetical protein
MIRVLESISEAIAELFKWKLNVRVIVTGVVTTLIWGLLGWLVWPYLYGLSSEIMNLLPFAMLRSDGAYIFIALVWALGTMVTFAVTMLFFGEFISRKVSGEKYVFFLPMLISGIALFWGAIVYIFFDKLYVIFVRILTSLPFEFTEKGVAGLIALYVIYNGIIVTLVAITSIRGKYILEPIRKEKYPNEKLEGGMIRTIGATLKGIAIFLGASLVLFPLFFIPMLNIAVEAALYIWLFRDVFKRDVCALYCTEEERATHEAHISAAQWVVAAIAALMAFIPFVNFFAPVFGEITAFHYLMKSKEDKRLKAEKQKA